jgi:hypothetical protein
MSDREIPAEISANLQRWLKLSNLLRFIQVLLGSAGTCAALIAAMFPEMLGPFWMKVCLFVAAIFFTIPTAFDIGGKANGMRQACRYLTTAMLRYRYVPQATIDNLIDSNSQAQEMIGGITFRRPDAGDSKTQA